MVVWAKKGYFWVSVDLFSAFLGRQRPPAQLQSYWNHMVGHLWAYWDFWVNLEQIKSKNTQNGSFLSILGCFRAFLRPKITKNRRFFYKIHFLSPENNFSE